LCAILRLLILYFPYFLFADNETQSSAGRFLQRNARNGTCIFGLKPTDIGGNLRLRIKRGSSRHLRMSFIHAYSSSQSRNTICIIDERSNARPPRIIRHLDLFSCPPTLTRKLEWLSSASKNHVSAYYSRLIILYKLYDSLSKHNTMSLAAA